MSDFFHAACACDSANEFCGFWSLLEEREQGRCISHEAPAELRRDDVKIRDLLVCDHNSNSAASRTPDDVSSRALLRFEFRSSFCSPSDKRLFMAKGSVLKVKVDAPTARLLRLYAKDHRISMGEFLEYVIRHIDIDEVFEDTSDHLLFTQRKGEGPGISLEELMKRLNAKSKKKKPVKKKASKRK